MILFPAIDLVAGQVVRLRRGERSQMDVYASDPVAVARDFAARGATWVHVVDLSAAFEEDDAARAANDAAIRGICEVDGLSVDVGGGVRSLGRIEQLASYGARRIALGTILVRDRAFARQAAERFGELLVADVAARDGEVAVNGWREDARVRADDLVGELAGMGFTHLVFTDIARDGMQTGVNTAVYEHIAQVAGFPVVASGGIASLADIEALAALDPSVVEGAITGRALYEGAFTLEEALASARAPV
ncbi:MAG: 1-(5-phosphoribosyl)-5-((5-phosphoribosylamino)methylideneamino)imidazole-4-carboxamide isomerase [Coriobacteriia bacterium]|nr:1-(5-phosphoribosyl)-5-((5-phosphoribosylamino)methylideneamino)imidazole-4-carboxamide isomerase [Coriobacteriia bacterium]